MKLSQYDLYSIPVEDRETVLLQSGGLDSVYLSHILHQYGFKVTNLFVDYGQNAKDKELEAAKKVAEKYNQHLEIAKIDFPWLKEKSLINSGAVNPDVDKSFRPLAAVIDGEYVPMRNMVLISIASSLAETRGIKYITSGLDGIQCPDGSLRNGTPDKHPVFVMKLEQALIESSSMHHLGEKDFEILCPIMGNLKHITIALGKEFGCDFTDSWSCYNSGEKPCLVCGACQSRLEAFESLGFSDPTVEKFYGKYDSLQDLYERENIKLFS